MTARASFVWANPVHAVVAAESIVRRVCEEIRRDAVTSMSAEGTGRTYRRRGRTHTASSPGNPPAVDTGRLKQSIVVVMHGRTARDRNVVVGSVGTTVHYAPHVEFGTIHMQPRPFLGPALEKARRRYG